MMNSIGRRRFWSVLSLAALVIGGGFALLNKDFAEALFWPLWTCSVVSVLTSIFPTPDGVALIRKEMSPTDLPPGAKIPRTLMRENQREEKS
jgi:hypothetical protein